MVIICILSNLVHTAIWKFIPALIALIKLLKGNVFNHASADKDLVYLIS